MTYVPAPNAYGTDTLTYQMSDGKGGYAEAIVTIDVIPVNDPPAANDDIAMTDEDTAVTVDVLANDSDTEGDPLTVTSVSTPSNGMATINPDGTITYTPAANFNGSDSLTYAVADGNGGAATAMVNITVNPVNDAPDVSVDLSSESVQYSDGIAVCDDQRVRYRLGEPVAYAEWAADRYRSGGGKLCAVRGRHHLFVAVERLHFRADRARLPRPSLSTMAPTHTAPRPLSPCFAKTRRSCWRTITRWR